MYVKYLIFGVERMVMTNAIIWCELCVDSQQRTNDEYFYRMC